MMRFIWDWYQRVAGCPVKGPGSRQESAADGAGSAKEAGPEKGEGRGLGYRGGAGDVGHGEGAKGEGVRTDGEEAGRKVDEGEFSAGCRVLQEEVDLSVRSEGNELDGRAGVLHAIQGALAGGGCNEGVRCDELGAGVGEGSGADGERRVELIVEGVGVGGGG